MAKPDRHVSDYSSQLERTFVLLVDSRANARGWGKGEFAQKVWPEDSPKSAATKWAAIRSRSSNTGKPQGVLLSDAQRMAEALGEDLAYLLAVAKEKTRDADILNPDMVQA